ncbi:MAG: beta-lactamase family protein [Clostridia bacterium]|nr:beta-lactamase family protein [Clostridia bacterium]
MKKEYIEAFESLIKEFAQVYKAQGIIVGILDDKDLLYQRSFGYRNVEKEQPIDENTIFGIASITKSFTVIRLMQLAEAGLIDLETPLDELYEDWQLPKEHTPKIKHLMSHVAGFYPQERFLMKDVADELGLEASALHESLELSKRGIDMIIARLNQSKLFIGPPGEYFSYSNFSFGILTDLVERFSDESSYAASVMNHIIKPMGLEHTFFDFERTKNESNITRLYTAEKDGVKVTDDYMDAGFVLLGGGAIKSTLKDLLTYTRLYLNDGVVNDVRILEKASVDAMMQERIVYKDGQGYGYALVTGDLDDMRYVGHSGGLTGVSSFFGFNKTSGKGVVVLCNTGGVPATAIGMAALRLAHDLYPDYKTFNYVDGIWSDDAIQKTLGTYISKEGDHAEVVLREGQVKIIANGVLKDCRTIRDDLMLIVSEMEESQCRILRNSEDEVYALYLGSRIIPKVG